MSTILEFLDSIGITDPLWGTLGWLAVIGSFWLYFGMIYLMFGPWGPCGKAWKGNGT